MSTKASTSQNLLPALQNSGQAQQNANTLLLLNHLKEKLQNFKHKHLHQLNQVDLNLETTPRDSRYSNGLLDLMKKEEIMLKDPNSPATKTIVQRVDDSLRLETKSFFAKLTNANLRKWEALQDKLKKDREALKQEFLRELQAVEGGLKGFAEISSLSADVNRSKRQSPNHVYTLEDIEREEARLEVDYYKNWHQYEMVHLQEAFRLQTMKIDNDWAQHEKTIRAEFEAKKAQYLPKSQQAEFSHASSSAEEAGQQRWHNAEKQKTLIHTAPVFAPSTQQLSRPSSSGVNRKRENNAMANALEVSVPALSLPTSPPFPPFLQLERLDKEYQETLSSLLRQKADAKRWLLRQQIRLNAQCEEVRKEKSFVAQLLEDEYRDYLAVQQTIQQLARKHQETSQRPPTGSSGTPQRIRAFSGNDADLQR